MDQNPTDSIPAPAPASIALPWRVFLQRIFSDNGEPSSSRVLTFILAIVCLVLLSGVVRHICVLKDVATLGLWLASLPSVVFALIAFMNAPYLINRGSGSISDIAAVFKKGDRQ